MNILVWLRRDLRTQDNPALHEAARVGTVIPVFILEEETEQDQPLFGCARSWWLHSSLKSLKSAMPNLILRKGKAIEALEELIVETDSEAVYWNRRYEPKAAERDRAIFAKLADRGVEARVLQGSILHEPEVVLKSTGDSYKVFTHYLRKVRSLRNNTPKPAPAFNSTNELAVSDNLEDWGLITDSMFWTSEWNKLWTPGEDAAVGKLDDFIQTALENYANRRDEPAQPCVSRLSPHLHFGEISPTFVVNRVLSALKSDKCLKDGADKFLAEIVWREFAHYLLFHCPSLPEKNWNTAFDAYPWENDESKFEAWKKGQTGYPLVDAGMRELWQTGYMHNRVRMVVASFLTKHLRIDWKKGAQWFLETLLDADIANNSFGWQWVAGSGADAAPYFRVFNPTLQSRKFDSNGNYIRKWCPELAKLDSRHIHEPSSAPALILSSAGIELGVDYPTPIVGHTEARDMALKGFELVKKSGKARNDGQIG